MSLAFVLLDFQHAGVRRRAQCAKWSVDMQQCIASTTVCVHCLGRRALVDLPERLYKIPDNADTVVVFLFR